MQPQKLRERQGVQTTLQIHNSSEWETEGRKHWWPQVAQAVIGVLRARAALGEKKDTL